MRGNDNFDEYNIKQGSGVQPYQEFTYDIPVGQGVDVDFVFSYFRVISKSGGELSLNFGGSSSVVKFTGAGIGVTMPRVYPRVRLINSGATAMNVTIALGMGAITDDRLTVSTALSTKDVGTSLVSFANFSTSTTAAICLSANASRKEAIITNLDPAIEIYIGDSAINNSTRKGIRLAPLAQAILSTTAVIYAVSASGTPQLGLVENVY